MRIVYTTSRPHPISQQLAHRPLWRVLTPTPQAARSLGVAHQSLETLAVGVLGKHGWGLAPLLTAWRALETAVAEAISPEDIPGTARMWEPTLKEFLQGGGNFWHEDITALDAPNMVRVQELQRLAKVYTAKLKQKRLVDKAELFWHAAGFSPGSQPLLVCGYDFPRADELSFLNAVAGEGSILVLPLVEEPLFDHNQKALVWLQEQGWGEETGGRGDGETGRRGDGEEGEGWEEGEDYSPHSPHSPHFP
ncbi:MAG TPA: hypothetical protein IGS52_09670, partial [Oscillatoriaceae cyanobacterium M33_DOE_052]|nr:hypothetical protein [Oscillatoriaceae cyanobacterium M33_DOE_052]